MRLCEYSKTYRWHLADEIGDEECQDNDRVLIGRQTEVPLHTTGFRIANICPALQYRVSRYLWLWEHAIIGIHKVAHLSRYPKRYRTHVQGRMRQSSFRFSFLSSGVLSTHCEASC